MLRLALIVPLAACAAFPELDTPDARTEAARAAPFPRLVPLDQLLGRAEEIEVDEATGEGLDARAAALKARAARLRATTPGG